MAAEILLMLLMAYSDLANANEALGELSESYEESESEVCKSASAKTCQDISVPNIGVINNFVMDFPGVETLYSQNNIIGDSRQFYSESGSYALFTSDENSRSIFGFLNTVDGRHFIIERSENDHVLIESDPKLFKDELVLRSRYKPITGTKQNSEIVPARVKFYYTNEFSKQTFNIDIYAKTLVETTNIGFTNSGVRIRIVKYTVEKSDVVESDDIKTNTKKLLQKFRESKPSSELLDGHEIAILLFPAYTECKADPGATCSCGAAYTLSSVQKPFWNVGLVRKDCGVGQYSLGHVLGKMFGGGDVKQEGIKHFNGPTFTWVFIRERSNIMRSS